MIDTTQPKKEVREVSFKEKSWDALCSIQAELSGQSDAEVQAKLRQSVQTLFKILTNIQGAPFEQKFRRLPKKSERIQQQILGSPSAQEFLKLAGFSFDSSPEFIEFNGWSAEQEQNLGQSVENIATLVSSIGGVVDDPNRFDPFKSSVSSTTGNRPQIGNTSVNKVTTTLDAISQIKKERE